MGYLCSAVGLFERRSSARIRHICMTAATTRTWRWYKTLAVVKQTPPHYTAAGRNGMVCSTAVLGLLGQTCRFWVCCKRTGALTLCKDTQPVGSQHFCFTPQHLERGLKGGGSCRRSAGAQRQRKASAVCHVSSVLLYPSSIFLCSGFAQDINYIINQRSCLVHLD